MALSLLFLVLAAQSIVDAELLKSPTLRLVYSDALASAADVPLGDERFWFTERNEWSYVPAIADDRLGNPVPDSGPALAVKSRRTYQPRVRSPHSLALLRGYHLDGNFAFEVEAMQTGIETAHRDLVLVFGFQSAEQFYYCHLGAVPDEHSSNVFVVNEEPRRRVGEISTKPIDWDRGVWHRLRVECTRAGRVRVFLDGGGEPLFERELGRNPAGLVGFGSFDDAGAFRNLKLFAERPYAAVFDPTVKAADPGSPHWRTNPFGSIIEYKAHPLGRWFDVGRLRLSLMKLGAGWTLAVPTSGSMQRLIHFPPDAKYVTSDRLAFEAILNEAGDFDAPYRFRVGPAPQSRSDFLRSEYDRHSSGHPSKGDWDWALDRWASNTDERPVLLAVTPHGSPISHRWDAELFSDAEVWTRLSREFTLRRVDPSTAAPHSILPSLPLALAGLRQGTGELVVLTHDGRILGRTDDIEAAHSLREWLDRVSAPERAAPQDLVDPAAMATVPAEDPRRVERRLPRPGRFFSVGGRTAFLMEPAAAQRKPGPRPWVWYAPTLPGLPGPEEGWMFDRLLEMGIAIAGVDVGESYGSPKGQQGYDAFFEHMTREWGFAQRAVLLARSRGGLMLYSWATLHPEHVAGIAGIYPVCDISSYPGVERAAPAFELSPAELSARLKDYNPIERLHALAAARVPIFHIHGDRDTIVPLAANSAELRRRYTSLGGPMELQVLPGRGHDMWEGWFQSEELTAFLIQRACEPTAK